MTKDEALRLAVAALKKSKDALAEELAAWDIDPPLHHVLEAHDACEQTIKVCEEALAQAERESVKLKPEDVLVESCVVSRGGFVLKPSEGVRLTHRPTGRVIEVCEERSQHRNRAVAWEMLERLVAQEQQEAEPVGEFVKADCGDYPVLKWNENYIAKIGDKFYTHPKEQPEPEPVVVPEGFSLVAVKGLDNLVFWLDRCEYKGHLENCPDLVEPYENFEYREISTHPKQWVGLTNDEINNFAAGCHLGKSVQSAIFEAEAKLKEKNS